MNQKNVRILYSSWISFLFSVCLLFVSSCKDDNENEPTPTITNEANTYVNAWILDEMKFWYLWNDKIPSSSDKNIQPDAFFKSLLYSQDRFSWIQDNYIELLNSLQGISKEAGYEFVLYKEGASSNDVLAQILYVKSGSPAAQANLKRGDVITHINNERITTENYRSLMKAIKENHSITVKALLVEDEKFDTEKNINLNTVEFSENPNLLSKIITVDDKKIGYYVYTFFSSGANGNKQYDNEMDAIFQDFKSKGITDLVLDLRFNSGGSESAANNLASLIGMGVNSSKVFFKREYNSLVTKEILNDPNAGESFLTSRFVDKGSNLGSQLRNHRVYILTSSRTASASELIINGLKPYMDVFLIGNTTYGKSVGSISRYKKDDPKNTWGIQPIILKAFNSLSQSDYDNGFTPNVVNPDNSLYIYPLGDERENLLSQAIAQITGTASLGRVPAYEEREIVGHSIDFKKRSFNLIIDSNVPEVLNVD